MKIKSNLSTNHSKNIRSKKKIKFVIIHYTGMQSEIESVKRLKSPKAKVSCHYLINRRGNVIQMVSDLNIAWHAGKSKWKNFSNLNSNSLGIELVNKGHNYGYQNFSNLQIKNLIKLCIILKKKYAIKSENFLGHSDIAPLRKKDPGEKFPWKKMSRKRLGIWYPKLNQKFKNLSEKKTRILFFKNLYKIGYRYFNKKKSNKKNDKLIVKAFQRRFEQNNVTGEINHKTLEISHFLAKY
jgi:N-acetylmuramoyl-L-alanine amidase